jgi:hypothetical protein
MRKAIAGVPNSQYPHIWNGQRIKVCSPPLGLQVWRGQRNVVSVHDEKEVLKRGITHPLVAQSPLLRDKRH